MLKILLAILGCIIVFKSSAATVTVYNNNQKVQENVVVWLAPEQASGVNINKSLFTMTQKNRQFTPHILVVEKNSQVEFPNADSIMHHVYSFSKSKTFELKLYREQPQDPITFEQTGVVELGCNIHDWMLGYIVVVDSPYYAITNEQGIASFDIPNGSYKLNVWHEGFRDISNIESQEVVITNNKLSYQLKQKLTLPIRVEVDEFDDYE
ncbi:methylamine utilization protein [Pseudoalteromonas sp. APC 3224]|uniref:methylamine utilization protein n=1 Tax=Pseudoalteromonas sp. APC 3224 TaxID=3035203 RepID=UPI0025B28619|nr:methylamine utilization protein [Pseudoalteromonas sp. APC 3224]MDN3483879.1 methylamine utilization protein [Pseudoalteromonas sp. APC 3224]